MQPDGVGYNIFSLVASEIVTSNILFEIRSCNMNIYDDNYHLGNNMRSPVNVVTKIMYALRWKVMTNVDNDV